MTSLTGIYLHRWGEGGSLASLGTMYTDAVVGHSTISVDHREQQYNQVAYLRIECGTV